MELEKQFAANLTELRKSKQWTQLELAEKINYSDKTVSKWERGEGLPDLRTCCLLAQLFGVTLDYFVSEDADIKKYSAPREERGYRLGISLLIVVCIWVAVTVAFVGFMIYNSSNMWTLFVWGVPASAAVLFMFGRKWGRKRSNIIFSSVFCWSFIAAFYLQMLTQGYNLWALFFIGAPVQIALILWNYLNLRYR